MENRFLRHFFLQDFSVHISLTYDKCPFLEVFCIAFMEAVAKNLEASS